MPWSVPVASGRFGVRSPARYGTRTRPPLPDGCRQGQIVEPGVVDARGAGRWPR